MHYYYYWYVFYSIGDIKHSRINSHKFVDIVCLRILYIFSDTLYIYVHFFRSVLGACK